MSDSQSQFSSDNTDDIVGKIVQANSLESAGEIEQAIAVYQEIIQLDPNGNYGNVAQEALANLQQSESATIPQSPQIIQPKSNGLFGRYLSIKFKVTLLAILFGTIPVIAIGSTVYYVADKTIKQEITEHEKSEAVNIQDQVYRFMRNRDEDIQVMANLDIFTNSKLAATPEEKTAALERIKAAYKIYESIAIFDLQGEPIAQTQAGKKLSNHFNRTYIQAALKANGAILSQPLISSTSGTVSVYSASTIKDKVTGKPIGFIRARIPVKYLDKTLQNYKSTAREYYLINKAGEVFLDSEGKLFTQTLSSGKNSTGKKAIAELLAANQIFAKIESLLNNLTVSSTITTNLKSNSQQLVSYAPPAILEGMPNLDWGVILATNTDTVFKAQQRLRLIISLGTALAAILVATIASIVAARLTQPILRSAAAVKKLGQGEFDIRVPISGRDELADLGSNINKMAGQIQELLSTQEAEVKRQQREKEVLQKGVMSLLIDVEGAKKGDLTIRAEMTDGAVGSIADAFNATMKKLQGLLQEVQTVSTEVGQLSLSGEDSVRQLSESALNQAEEINQALSSIDEINQSIETVANYTQEAAQIARQGSIKAKEGDLAMDATVNSIEKIRTTVASTAKKVKQLAESSQEIGQIVEIISGISEKTNLLAFNASVEAARAGEHGEGFRIVAEEVRRLADRITESTKDIQQLVTAIQQDTTSVLQGMETSTAEVVNGSTLIRMTKQNLQSLAETSQQIDRYLKSISTNSINQTNTSSQVNEKINGIATVAQTNSAKAQHVVQSLRSLVQEAENLQSSVSQFKLQA